MNERVHVVVGAPWRDAVLKHLEPRSPFQPWRHEADVRENDAVIVVFDTEPALLLTETTRLGSDLDVGAAIARLYREWAFTDAVPVAQLGVELPVAPAVLDGGVAQSLIAAVEAQRFSARDQDRFGTSSMASARALLESGSRCTGCGSELPLSRLNAHELFSVWTVAAASDDWPAALCVSCWNAMRAGSFASFLDFKYFRHPRCPRCGRRRSKEMAFGMPVSPSQPPPWIDHRGCCVVDANWVCSHCRHEW